MMEKIKVENLITKNNVMLRSFVNQHQLGNLQNTKYQDQ